MGAIAELERQVIEADGGRLKLEWGRLRRRSGRRVEDLLWSEDGRLLGFLGFYGFGSSLELTGMVAPYARRRGVGPALLDDAVPLCRGLGYRKALLIVPRHRRRGSVWRCAAMRYSITRSMLWCYPATRPAGRTSQRSAFARLPSGHSCRLALVGGRVGRACAG